MTLSTATLRDRFEQLRSNKLFETFVILVIVISALMIGAKTYPIPAATAQLLRILDVGITLFFLTEIIIRMLAEKSLKSFFSKGWNIFDFLIVTASLIPVDDSEAALLGRLLRVFRVLRLVSIIPELRILMNAFVSAIPRMGYVSLLMFIIFYIYAAMGSMFFSEINRELWGNITIAMLTLFRVATFEDWTDVMYETMDVYPLSWSFYLSFIFVVAFVFLNMMIGIVLETLQREHEQFSRDSGEGEAGEVHRIDARTQEMEQRLIRMEEMLKRLASK
ncbi:MAG: ion transporter [gamma proteobacterium symbiont of Ctena orbiculata]|uniref:Ion transporter n=1 Tax=Candidatus Thiodiazotropha taylori TaxID=2792791 RepID=A0A944M961_9GAMM|nr:ion transporter [Candidatus Thiodiazotropha taylori]PUB85949.1 MAG: ion transporter [gamma proteobacterium symbiont of Ctena orbiculata]MBT2989107.1 ion transporter [Candidatus Thiodiazotropha taylori]MBT2995681.1 ion transporter [Candidatus Thiodiazotropha taylori]MBT2999364.1 ion transporter [Candidatus Thiodiazotropha taylori]